MISATEARAENSPSEWPAKAASGWIKPFESKSSKAAGHYDMSDRCKLSGEKKTFWMREGVLKDVDIDIRE